MKLRAFLALCLVTAGLSIVSGAAFFIALGLVTGADQALDALKEPRPAVIAADGLRQHRELGASDRSGDARSHPGRLHNRSGRRSLQAS